MRCSLSVNVNKVATLRNTRDVGVPSVTRCARICLEAGAQGITVHPRPDERHIRPRDVEELGVILRDFPDAELNIEGNPFTGLMTFAERHRPQQCTLVPDEIAQSTSDHGWNLAAQGDRLRPVIEQIHELGCRVSLFVDADVANAQLARELGADRIEIYTEPYAASFARGDHAARLAAICAVATEAHRLGVGVNAGHDLNRDNLSALLSAVEAILEVSIGHALVADALELGLKETVRQYLAIIAAVPNTLRR
jgi:pyridoxine 5-phosphate synthase